MPDELILEEGGDAVIIDSDTGDTLLVEETTTISTGYYWTDFREYRRGRFMPDWTQRWWGGGSYRVEGAWSDLNSRSVFRLQGVGTRSALTWNVVDDDSDRPDQEELFLFRWLENPTNRSVGLLRVSGGVTAENAYRLGLSLVLEPQIVLDKIVSGTVTALDSAIKSTVKHGAWIWCRFRAEGTALKARVWLDGDDEPTTWDVEATDASISDGSIGLGWVAEAERAEVKYFSATTGGKTATDYATALTADPVMDTWISDPTVDVDITVRLEYYNPTTDAIEESWYSNIGRITGPDSYPADTIMLPLLIDAGTLAARLEADAYFGGVVLPSREPIRLDNRPDDISISTTGPLDSWPELSFYGRPVEIRIGRRWSTPPRPGIDGIVASHRRFEIVACGIASQEPTVTTEEATLPLGPPSTMLSERIHVYHNVGIPYGIKSLTSSGYLSIPSHTAYDTDAFTIYLRVLIPAAGVPGLDHVCTLTQRQTNSSLIQWKIILFSEDSNSPSQIQIISNANSGDPSVNVLTGGGYNIDRYVDIIYGVDSSRHWYAYVDGMKVGSGTPAAIPHIAATRDIEVLYASSVNISVCDFRIDKYVDEDEALSRFSARREPDTLTLAMHRCDGGSGDIVTDYSTYANHGDLQGTDVTDRLWVLTYLGSAELVGTFMPYSGGVLYHAPTQPIDPDNNVYRYNDRDRTVGADLEIRAKGFVLIPGVGNDYIEPVDGSGTIDIDGAVDQPVTFGLPVSTATAHEDERIHIPRLVKDELISRGSLSPLTCDQDSFSALRKLLPSRGGFYFDAPPTVADFLTSILSPTGSYYGLDTSGRVMASMFMPAINPGPYGQDNLLELVGYPMQGVVLPYDASYDLTQSAEWSITCWIKLHRPPIDLSTSSTFTYFPSGMTIVDHISGATGYYVGIDGRDGNLIFGAPDVTSLTTSLHYLKLNLRLKPETWYAVHAVGALEQRSIKIWDLEGRSTFAFEATSATALAATIGAPVLIGHGVRGSFVGSMAYVVGASTAHTGSYFDTWHTTEPELADEAGSRFWIDLRDGAASGDYALEQVQQRYARISGCRWCPRLVLDSSLPFASSIPSTRRMVPSWRAAGQYKHNRSVLSGSNVAAGVSAADRVSLSLPHLSEIDSSATLRTNYLNSRDITLQTPFLSPADTDEVIRTLRARLGVDRRASDVLNWYRDLLCLGVSDEVLVKDARWYSGEGRAMRVIAWLMRMGGSGGGSVGGAGGGEDGLRGDVGVWG